MKPRWICRSFSRSTVFLFVIWTSATMPSQAAAQSDRAQTKDEAAAEPASTPRLAPGEKPPSTLIEISDEPKTVDPTTLMPEKLATRVTVSFKEQPIREIAKWLQQELSLNVLVDYQAMSDEGLLAGEPITDHSEDAPLFLLLNRLDSLPLGWYFEDDTLFVTTQMMVDQHLTTTPYNLGDLFDDGYKPQAVIRTIQSCTPGKWSDVDGDGGAVVLLGDVLFVRQTMQVHQQVTVDFQETPLIFAAQELSVQAQISIRLERAALSRSSIRDRTPVSLKLADQKLNAVLRSLLSNLGLTWYLRDDVLWITTVESAAQVQKTAVFDVRDLCRDREESAALHTAIQKQTRAKWRPASDSGGFIEMPESGVLVVRHTEATLDEVLRLLENYRIALRASKLRVVAEPDPMEVVTGYYRLPRPMAEDLQIKLPFLVLPESWRSRELPDAAGYVLEVSVDSKGGIVQNRTDKGQSNSMISEYAVLVIRQSRTAHRMIGKLIETLIKSQLIDQEATLDPGKRPLVQPGSFGSSLIPPTTR